jgi:ABC-type proline/glycine betaine transport system permease subunit
MKKVQNTWHIFDLLDKWLHVIFILLAIPIGIALSRYTTAVEVLLLAILCFIFSLYSSALFIINIRRVFEENNTVLMSLREHLEEKIKHHAEMKKMIESLKN